MGLTVLFLFHSGGTCWGQTPDLGNEWWEMFNKAAHFMGPLCYPHYGVRPFRWLFLHIIQGYVSYANNQAKRKIGYRSAYGAIKEVNGIAAAWAC